MIEESFSPRGSPSMSRTRLKTTRFSPSLYTTQTKDGLGCRYPDRLGAVVSQFTLKSGKYAQIIQIDTTKRRNVQLARRFLDLVNRELNAPLDKEQWMDGTGTGASVFVCAVGSKLVAVCSTETPTKGYWMVHETGRLVPGRSIDLDVGISRIYTAVHYRREGIALELLEAVTHHSIYGLDLKASQVGWSQPSRAGGLLALKFNGVKHKSDKYLIPVYKQE